MWQSVQPAFASDTAVPQVGRSEPTPVGAGVARSTPFTWQGSPWDLAGTAILNMVLTLATLGIYGFWGRTELRRRMWSSVRLCGEPLAYHGTAKELMRGFFAVLVVVLAPLFVLGTIVVVYFGQASAVFSVYQIGLFAVLYPVLAAVAFYRARRYRLARTSWRGIRGSLSGSSLGYGSFSWLTAAAYPFTLGWIAPYRAVELQRYIVKDTQLGDRPLVFDGTSKPVYRRYALLWFGTIILYVATFGVIGAVIGRKFNPNNPLWLTTVTGRDVALVVLAVLTALIVWSLMSSFYFARLYNHLARSTLIGPVRGDGATRFELDVTGKRIIWLFLTNALITYLSLYALKPVATARSMKYFTEHLSIVGPFDPDAIGQSRIAVDSAGEGLAQAFDLDAF